MKRKTRKQLSLRFSGRRPLTRVTRRRGSTLLIVMVLMGMLSLLGVLFYTFSAQERSNSEYYSDAAKVRDDAGLSADVLMDWGLQQIIVSTDSRLKNSALWGSRHSMLSNMLGLGDHRPGDTHPYNGQGVNVIFNSSGAPIIDQDRDGIVDSNEEFDGDRTANANELLQFCDSPSANNVNERQFFGEDRNRNGVLDAGEDRNSNGKLDGVFPQPDVGYSYPDINNVFLSYVAKVRDSDGFVHQVVIPSYLRPQYLRDSTGAPILEDLDGDGVLDMGEDTNGNGVLDNWYNLASTANKVMRAHPSHVYVLPDPPPGTTPPLRYFLTDADAQTKTGNASARQFPFRPMDSTYDTSSGGGGPAYTSGRMGVWTKTDADPANDHLYEFDIDLDGDGIKEAVWMDLDFPPQENASGDLFVPLYAVTIVDLDSLINLNLAGNTTKTQSQSVNPITSFSISSSAGTPFCLSEFLSGSNQGLTPAEVNPAWALTARPALTSASPPGDAGSAAALNDHLDFFGGAPQDTSSLSPAGPVPTWREAANMELLWLKVGRAKIKSGGGLDDIFPGVYGEEHIVAQNYTPGSPPYFSSLPRAGVSVQDDNGDLNEGMAYSPFFGHPLDFAGLGTYVMPLSGNPQDAKKPNFLTSGKNRFLQYNRYADNGNVRWGAAAVGSLLQNSLPYALGDDAMEVKHYAEDKSDVDDPLKAEEMLALQLNNTELNNLTVSSRVLNLAPFNFAKDSSVNSRGEKIRRRFTTQSNDRKSYSLPYSPTRTWEYSLDTAPYSPSVQGPYVQQVQNTRRFPPEFGTGTTPIRRYSMESGSEDPIRPPVRALLEIENLSTRTARWQRKLSVNQLLTVEGNQLTFRPLYAHPIDPGTTVVNTTNYPNVANPNYKPQSAGEFEFCARRDRQQLARDIYVLLYLLGHGSDAINTATASNASNAVYSAAQMAEMAQFAVNLIDNMDADQVMTRFEYDTDLSNGWDLDDNPYSSSGESDRAEVYGVERLDLTISEAMAIHTDAVTGGNHEASSYDDTNPHNFLYVELRNGSPFDVTFDSTSEAWQVVVKQDAGTSGGTPYAGWERRLSLKNGTVSPDARYTIGSPDYDTGGATAGRSIFKVDPNWTAGTPDFTLPSTWMAPWGVACTLDLIDATNTDFRVEDAAGSDLTATKGSWLEPLSLAGTGSADGEIKVVLRRRAHPTRTRISPDTDNPWVEVDEMILDAPGPTSFALPSSTANSTMIQAELDDLISRQRAQPLRAQNASVENWSAAGIQRNSLTANNTNSPATFDLWQIHFDRDYASIGELLNLFLVAPVDVAEFARSAYYECPNDQITGGGARLAAAKVLLPAHPTDSTLDNRWHRLFEFLEVPTRANKNLGIGTDLAITRVPGRINLNMLRHPEVYAGLIDDYRLVSLNLAPGLTGIADDPEAGLMPDQTSEAGRYSWQASRDWWQEFIESRDLIDPYWSSQSTPVDIPLPGLPGSKPFRSAAYLGTVSISGTNRPALDDSIFRGMPYDSGQTSARRLLEVGNQSEHQTAGSIDPYIRHRLLSKIHGNTTNRSHCYAVFIAVKYFIAGEDGNAIRIGGPLNGKPEPEHRGFFVVDRSKLEKGANAGVGGYDFRAFVDYRRIIKTQ